MSSFLPLGECALELCVRVSVCGLCVREKIVVPEKKKYLKSLAASLADDAFGFIIHLCIYLCMI